MVKHPAPRAETSFKRIAGIVLLITGMGTALAYGSVASPQELQNSVTMQPIDILNLLAGVIAAVMEALQFLAFHRAWLLGLLSQMLVSFSAFVVMASGLILLAPGERRKDVIADVAAVAFAKGGQQ